MQTFIQTSPFFKRCRIAAKRKTPFFLDCIHCHRIHEINAMAVGINYIHLSKHMWYEKSEPGKAGGWLIEAQKTELPLYVPLFVVWTNCVSGTDMHRQSNYCNPHAHTQLTR